MSRLKQAYGTWSSPLSPKALADMLRLSDVQWDTNGDTRVWLEGRGARGVLVAQAGIQAPRDLTGSDISVRGLVGYGGGDFTAAGGDVYFAGPNGRLYRQALAGGNAAPITPAFGEAASPRVSADGKWLLFVHSYERKDSLALVDTHGAAWPRKIAEGTDFVMQPAWHPTGEYAAFIAWNHPQMPWDGTELRLLAMEYDRAGVPNVITTLTIAGDTNTAIFQPEFSPDGHCLAYVSDAGGWNQLYFYDLARQTHKQLTTTEADHGSPAWVQGIRVYGWTADSKSLVYRESKEGFSSLWRVEIESGKSSRIEGLDHYTNFDQIAVSPSSNQVAFIGSSIQIPARVVTFTFDDRLIPTTLELKSETPTIQVLSDEHPAELIHRRATTENTPPAQLAQAKPISWKGHDGETVYGLYYAPKNDRYEGIGAPPLVVSVHGGPTDQVKGTYSGAAQFFTTMGYAGLIVNYRGSTGYGKAYMNKLRENWGVYDVEDCATGASFLASQGLADPSKFIIWGGSAGGYTVLQSLVDKPGFYKVGVCLYGISNQFTLVSDTHKFEERYSDSLLGTLPESAARYRDRSPGLHVDKIVDPVIIYQGEDDPVVPKSQSDSIVASLSARGVPHEYYTYPGEGHGWRKPETIEHYYNTVIRFLKQYVIFG
jgi:dipeptidyl aminopeptidase/acylaminoacyl peptidase